MLSVLASLSFHQVTLIITDVVMALVGRIYIFVILENIPPSRHRSFHISLHMEKKWAENPAEMWY